MIEPYQWLIDHAEQYGYRKDLVGPASVDLCLAAKTRDYQHTDLCIVGVNADSVIFQPGVFYLCSTQEYITVPETHCAFINMRSSWARKGLGHKMAGFIDPGFYGQITLELETSMGLDIPIGTPIVQLIYMRLTEPTLKPYTGKYRGQVGPTEAYK